MQISDADKRALAKRIQENTVAATEKRGRAKICIYGGNGVGKTTLLVALAQKLKKPGQTIVLVDTNEGWLSLKNIPALLEGVDIVTYESPEQLYVIAEQIFYKVGKYANVGAVVLDDADFMAAKDLIELWQNRVRTNPESKLDKEKPERPEYLKLGMRWTEVLDFLYDKTPDVHVLMSAHDKDKTSQDGQTVLRTMPAFNPALADLIEGKLLICGRMVAKTLRGGDREKALYTREIQVHPTYAIDAKSRVGFDNIKYDAVDFINRIVTWSEIGGPEEKEADAVRRDLATKKLTTEDDRVLLNGPTEVNDDEAPVFVG